MNIYPIYFIKNLETERYIGDELEPYFERTWYMDYEDAREAAWTHNVMFRKDLHSRNKYVVEVKEMDCPIMYVKYDGCYRRFFDVHEAIHFYEKNETAWEIGYEKDGERRPLDLSKDWRWTDKDVICKKFDDHFWDSRFSGNFLETPGREFSACYVPTRTMKINGNDFKLDGTEWFTRWHIRKQLDEKATFTDGNGVVLTPKIESQFRYYDFGASFDDTWCSFVYPNGRLFGYIPLI